jgi:hypothetical protein
MQYAIEWNHYGLVTGEAHATHPGVEYLRDVVQNTGRVGAVLYETTNAEATLSRVNGTVSTGQHTQRPIAECKKEDGGTVTVTIL